MQFVREHITNTLEVKQSKFIAHLVPYDKYLTTLTYLKNKHPKARHFVTAYRYLNEYEQIVEHSSDDGEPKGTSGKPSLMVLQGQELINSAVITVRYFGGTKLGTGGLVRAYSNSANLVAKEVIVEGEFDKSANLLIGNHTHNLDIALMESVIDEKLIWVAKKELGEIPVIKYMLTKTGMILVDRSDKRSVLKMLKEIKEKTQKGLKVVLFPEGTRNKINPKKMIKWKNGPKAAAEKLNLKVQPFVIVNLPFTFKNNPFRIEKQMIKVVFLPSFYPKDNPKWFEESKEKIQKVLDKEYSKMENEKLKVKSEKLKVKNGKF